MPNPKNATPPVNGRYGAPMGRISQPIDLDSNSRFTLQHVRLDSGGYDKGGAYWGSGHPLYWYCDDDCQIEGYFRAHDRSAAKEWIRSICPNARFYR